MYCLDTDLVVAFFRKSPEAASKIQEFKASDSELVITSITLCELYRGAFLSLKKDENLALVNNLLERASLLVQDKISCLLFGQDYAFLQKKGIQTQEMDLMIAGICKANNAVLVTRNVKDFRNIPNLLVEKW